MKYKIPHSLYIILLLISIAITALTFFIKDPAWSTIVASVGAGGIASVGVAWMLDYRKTKIHVISTFAWETTWSYSVSVRHYQNLHL